MIGATASNVWHFFAERPRRMLVAYLVVWLAFGFSYWGLASVSSRLFVIQSDVNDTTRMNAFRRMAGLYVDDVALRPLLTRWDPDQHPLIGTAQGDDDFTYFLVDGQTIGSLWGDYYEYAYLARGASHFNWRLVSADTSATGANIGKYLIDVSTFELPSSISRNEILTDDRPIEGRVIDRGSLRFYTDVNPKDSVGKGVYGSFDIKYIPLHGEAFSGFLGTAKSFPDSSVMTLKAIRDDAYVRPVWDYLYFSAVTITTLGFGDILPNSTSVRVMVMLEAMLGVLIGGAFVAMIMQRDSERVTAHPTRASSRRPERRLT